MRHTDDRSKKLAGPHCQVFEASFLQRYPQDLFTACLKNYNFKTEKLIILSPGSVLGVIINDLTDY